MGFPGAPTLGSADQSPATPRHRRDAHTQHAGLLHDSASRSHRAGPRPAREARGPHQGDPGPGRQVCAGACPWLSPGGVALNGGLPQARPTSGRISPSVGFWKSVGTAGWGPAAGSCSEGPAHLGFTRWDLFGAWGRRLMAEPRAQRYCINAAGWARSAGPSWPVGLRGARNSPKLLGNLFWVFSGSPG